MSLFKENKQLALIIIGFLAPLSAPHLMPDGVKEFLEGVGTKNVICLMLLIYFVSVLIKFTPSPLKIVTYTRLFLWISFGIGIIVVWLGTFEMTFFIWMFLVLAVIHTIDLQLRQRGVTDEN